MALSAQIVAATPERAVSLPDIIIETIKIEGQVKTTLVHKICLDGQSYLMIPGIVGQGATLTLSFKDGKPEQCKVPSR